MGHTVIDAADVEPSFGVFRKMRQALGATGFGINQLELPPGASGVEHDETDASQEEVYVVLSGSGSMRDRRRGRRAHPGPVAPRRPGAHPHALRRPRRARDDHGGRNPGPGIRTEGRTLRSGRTPNGDAEFPGHGTFTSRAPPRAAPKAAVRIPPKRRRPSARERDRRLRGRLARARRPRRPRPRARDRARPPPGDRGGDAKRARERRAGRRRAPRSGVEAGRADHPRRRGQGPRPGARRLRRAGARAPRDGPPPDRGGRVPAAPARRSSAPRSRPSATTSSASPTPPAGPARRGSTPSSCLRSSPATTRAATDASAPGGECRLDILTGRLGIPVAGRKGMAVVDIEAARRRLESERARVVEARQNLTDDTSRSMEDAIDEDGNDSHMADSASETLDRGMELSIGDNADHLLESIDAALARIGDGHLREVRALRPVRSRPTASRRCRGRPSASSAKGSRSGADPRPRGA